MNLKKITIILLTILVVVGSVILTKEKYKTRYRPVAKLLEVQQNYSTKLLSEHELDLATITENDYVNARQPSSSDENIGFCIVVPSYNNVEYVKQNFNSVFRQSYHNWRLIYVDDSSTDGTSELVRKIKADSHLDDNKFKLMRNSTRQRSIGRSLYNAAHDFCKNNEVMVVLDGDDMLAHSSVLNKLAYHYDNSNIWITYGSFIITPFGTMDASYFKEASESEWSNLRSIPWRFSHLRSAYTWLFRKISVDDLKYQGKFMGATNDIATVLPMLEMAGKNRTKFIDDIMYIYRMHDRNESALHTQEQRDMEKYIRSLPRYQELSADYKPGGENSKE